MGVQEVYDEQKVCQTYIAKIRSTPEGLKISNTDLVGESDHAWNRQP
jgi:hypothetical protein